MASLVLYNFRRTTSCNLTPKGVLFIREESANNISATVQPEQVLRTMGGF